MQEGPREHARDGFKADDLSIKIEGGVINAMINADD
jgi:hypothetical protein